MASSVVLYESLGLLFMDLPEIISKQSTYSKRNKYQNIVEAYKIINSIRHLVKRLQFNENVNRRLLQVSINFMSRNY